MQITPAILPKKFSEIEEKIEQIIGTTDLVQVDICDGKFVPTITWPYWKTDENFEAILREERGMPEWEKINYEFDLMIDKPTEDDARKWLSAGAERIILHLASSDDLNPLIDVLHGLVEIGIAVNNTADISDLDKYIDKIQFIQVMGIRKAGFQGQQFETKALDKVKELRAKYPEMKIQVDGGVDLENVESIKNAGADVVVVGSALFNSENVFETLEEFKSI